MVFCFCNLELQKKELFLARDALGVKPLYYDDKGSRFSFCSELKGLEILSDSNKRINFEALRDYLIFSFAGPKHSFCIVEKLLPGESLLIGKGGLRKQNIWYHPQKFLLKKSDQNIGVHAEKLQSLLKNAVKSQLVSDVGVGAFCLVAWTPPQLLQ